MEEQQLNDKPGLNFDEIISRLGGFDRFQWVIEAVFCCQMVPYVFQVLIIYFAAIDPDWRCVSNSSICLVNTTMPSNNGERCYMPRSEWEYTVPKDFSIVTQFDLQCDRKWMHRLLLSIIFVGWGFGAIPLGYLADKHGRRIILLSSFAILLLVSFVSSFMPNFTSILICRLIIGICIPGIQSQGITILSEFVGPKQRTKAAVFPSVIFSVALCLLPLHAYFIRKWKTLLIVCSAPYFVIIPLSICFIPESVRWLRLKGRMDEVMIIIKRIVRYNRRVAPNDLQIELTPENTQHNSSPLEIFRTRKIGLISITQGYVWFASGMVYYGLALAAKDLGGSLYLNFFLLTIVQIPSSIWTMDLCERFGRKKTAILSMFAASISCAAIAIAQLKILRIIFGMIGKFCMSIVFSTLYVWAVELYPTNIRASGNGFLQVTSRMGAASAPWVAKGLLTLHMSAPFIVMATVSFLATGVLFLLPETKDVPTLETIEDIGLL